MYIDKMLNGNVAEQSREQNDQIPEERRESVSMLEDSNAFVADPLMTKVNPEAVQGQIQIPQTTASAVLVHSNEDYDEECGDYVSSTPMTTAVEVTDAPTVSEKRSHRRTRIFIAVVVLMILTAFIIWPLVVFKIQKKGAPSISRRPPREWEESGDFDSNTTENVFGGNGNETQFSPARNHNGQYRGIRSSSHSRPPPRDEDESDDFEQGTNEYGLKYTPPASMAKTILLDPITLALNGQSYQCVSILQQFQPP
jgi:hypothetical protein